MKRILAGLAALLFCTLPWRGVAAAAETAEETLLAALYEADVTAVREAICEGLVSCETVTRYFLRRIEAHNQPYNCFITLCDDAPEIARLRDEQLKQGEPAGTLFGVPVVVKDNIDMAGYVTTNGHKKEGLTPKETNAAVVESLLREGAVILGKTNMSTDAQDSRLSASRAVGETKNAYDTSLAAGGSSGGTAVAVSLNFAVAGLGTDTNSSLRIPAALNGCVTLRPTRKLISREGCTKLNGTRDTPGAVTRTVRDQAVLMDVLTNGAYAYAENLNADALRGLHIGVLEELAYPQEGQSSRGKGNFDPEVTAAFETAVAQLRQGGARVTAVSMPSFFSLAAATFADSETEFACQQTFYAAFEAFLTEQKLDAVIFPAYSSTPLSAGNAAWKRPFVNNCRLLSPSTGAPEISVPMGQHSTGAGMGLEIVGRKHSEQLLLNVAYAFTEQNDRRVVPKGAPNAYAAQYGGSLRELIAAAKQPPTTTVPSTTVTAAKATTVSSVAADTVPDARAGLPPWALPVGIAAAGITAAAVLTGLLRRKTRYVKRHAQKRR